MSAITSHIFSQYIRIYHFRQQNINLNITGIILGIQVIDKKDNFSL